MKTVLAIAGSLRRGSYNRLLLQAARLHAPAGMIVQVYDELSSIPLFDQDLETARVAGSDSVERLRTAVGSADGLLIATPEYNWSIPGVLKNAIDWLSRPKPFKVLEGKPIAIIGASSGRWGTRLAQGALRQVLSATESLVMPTPAMFVRDAAERFDTTGRLVDGTTQLELQALLTGFARWIDIAGAEKKPAAGSLPRVRGLA